MCRIQAAERWPASLALGILRWSLALPACPRGVVAPVRARTATSTWARHPSWPRSTLALPVGSYFAVATRPDETVPAQVFQEGEKRFLALILPHVAKARATGYILTKRSLREPDSSQGIAFRSQGREPLVELDQRLLTEYRVDTGSKPIFFPLIGPTGESYTRAYPMQTVAGEDHDHPHQRSCWFTHGNVNGVDFWGEARSPGRSRRPIATIVVEGPVLGRLATKDDWHGPDGGRVCRTSAWSRSIAPRTRGSSTSSSRSMRLDGPVTFRDTKEGMFGLRVASSMDVTRKTGGKITNAEGLTDEKAWGKPSPWVDYVGPVNGKTVGIAVLNHPGSFRYPTTWHVRTVRPVRRQSVRLARLRQA